MKVGHDRTLAEAKADEEALEWVVRLTSGDSTPEDHARFRSWRDEDPLHGLALTRARTLWGQLGAVLPEIERGRERATFPRRRQLAWALPIAAALLLAVGIGQRYWQVWRFDQVTATAERRTVALPDGSEVMLGADTALAEQFDGRERRVTLARGQAFFRVRHQPGRPFIVRAGDADVRDIGTAFDVALRGDGTRVVVQEGLVEVSSGGRPPVRLAANQALEASAAGPGPVGEADAGLETAWMRGRLILPDRSLGQIVEAIRPYYSRRIILLNRAVAERRMTAVINLDDIDDWLEALGKTPSVRVTRLPGVLILS